MVTEILKPSAENLRRASELIRAGEVVAFPTETVYGLGADGLNDSARKKIYSAKKRPPDKPLTLHVASFAQVERVAKISLTAEKLFRKFCPGPLTIILPKSDDLPSFVTNSSSVGIRFPKNEIALELIKFSDCPIAAPSANISGQPPPKSAQEVLAALNGKIPAILDGGTCQLGISSTIIDLSGQTPKILRHGAIPAEIILGFLNDGRSF